MTFLYHSKATRDLLYPPPILLDLHSRLSVVLQLLLYPFRLVSLPLCTTLTVVLLMEHRYQITCSSSSIPEGTWQRTLLSPLASLGLISPSWIAHVWLALFACSIVLLLLFCCSWSMSPLPCYVSRVSLVYNCIFYFLSIFRIWDVSLWSVAVLILSMIPYRIVPYSSIAIHKPSFVFLLHSHFSVWLPFTTCGDILSSCSSTVFFSTFAFHGVILQEEGEH